MHLINLHGNIGNNKLIEITQIIFPFMVIPLILAAIFSQFSATVADIFGASGNIEEISNKHINIKKASFVIVIGAIIITWIINSSQVVALASRAFAFYYMMQAIVSLTIAKYTRQKLFFIALIAMLFFITFFAKPV